MGSAHPCTTDPGLDPGRAPFPRSRRLKRKQLIEPLFDRADPTSHSLRSGCIRIQYRRVAKGVLDSPIQIGVAVGKRHGSAPERNRIKRLLREVIRLEGVQLDAPVHASDRDLTAMFVFQGGPHEATRIRSDISRGITALRQRLEEDSDRQSPGVELPEDPSVPRS